MVVEKVKAMVRDVGWGVETDPGAELGRGRTGVRQAL